METQWTLQSLYPLSVSMQGGTSLEVQLSTLRKIGLIKNIKIIELKNKQRMMPK